jgi:hypothetical protein
MNLLRRVHLYLGCFFAPMVVFFCVSGTWQVFGLQWGDNARVLKLLSTIHMGQNVKPGPNSFTFNSIWLEYFVVLMAASLIVTIILGVVLAFRYGRGTLALASLFGGILVPVVLIVLFGHPG